MSHKQSPFPYNGKIFDPPEYWNPSKIGELQPSQHHIVEKAAEEFIRGFGEGLMSSTALLTPRASRIGIIATDLINSFLLEAKTLGLTDRESLYVPGALASAARFIEWGYSYVPYLSGFVIIRDDHLPHTVHSRLMYIDVKTGKFVDPYTPIFLEKLENGEITVRYHNMDPNPLAIAHKLREKYNEERKWNSTIMVWPTHAQVGSIEQALLTDFWRLVYFHSIVKCCNPFHTLKGMLIEVESYGAFEASVETNDPRSKFNMELFSYIVNNFDWFILVAQARTHCALDTVLQFVAGLKKYCPDKVKRVVIVEDWHDNIPDQPGMLFKKWADDAFAAMQRDGVILCTSKDAILHDIVTGVYEN